MAKIVPKVHVKKMFDQHGESLKGHTEKEVKRVCNIFMRTMMQMVLKGEKVTLTNHLSLRRSLRKEQKDAYYELTMEMKPALKARFEAIEVEGDLSQDPSSSSE